MRFATVRTERGTHAARLEGDRFVLLDAPDVGALLAAGGAAEVGAVAASGADLGPPVLRPGKIVCLGLNYEPHIRETGRQVPTHPTLFAKYAAALTGPRDPITLPKESDAVDWEVELAFVIGSPARRVDAAAAPDHIAGYTVINDVSMRDWQRRTLQWLQGKTFEGCTPVGPVLVTPDEVDHAADLEVRCSVDGEVMQRARTSELLFDPATIVEYVSRIVTLEPGDLIATGTPGGIGEARRPPRFLAPGQTLVSAVEGIGELVNEIR